MIPAVFYRNQGAYLVGRIRSGDQVMPLTLALHHEAGGIVVDAVLLTADEVSIIFSFTRSYFHVEVHRPRDLVMFLKSIMPRKPIAELYIAIGYNKHGKTELYRDLMRHIDRSTDTFEIAPGDRGMVMCVFTLPSFDVVFKVIRDRFAYPKTSSRRDVMERYQLVFKHDRAGRLADVQEFEHLAFARDRFSADLLDELAGEAAETVPIGSRIVEIKHVYVERRMTPLNLFIREAQLSDARKAIIDYGQAVRDLAATNIFPGDMLLKNFGVTRHGRVVFYDYDELCLVTDCQFRELPAAADESDEFGAEPWFYVGPSDIFPEEFINFMGLGGELRATFLKAHARPPDRPVLAGNPGAPPRRGIAGYHSLPVLAAAELAVNIDCDRAIRPSPARSARVMRPLPEPASPLTSFPIGTERKVLTPDHLVFGGESAIFDEGPDNLLSRSPDKWIVIIRLLLRFQAYQGRAGFVERSSGDTIPGPMTWYFTR